MDRAVAMVVVDMDDGNWVGRVAVVVYMNKGVWMDTGVVVVVDYHHIWTFDRPGREGPPLWKMGYFSSVFRRGHSERFQM